VTNVDRIAMEMESADAAERRDMALELVKLRRLEAECRRHQRRLPHQVQTALRIAPLEYDIEPPAIGVPDLFANGSSA
jgi:hypothetical protein